MGDGSTALLTKPSDLLKGAPSLYTGMRLPNAVQSKNFVNDAWAEISSNEPKWAQKSSKEPKSI